MSKEKSNGVPLSVQASDGHRFEVLEFRAESSNAPVVVLMPAMGVEAGYYDKMAGWLAARGFHVIVSDLRAHGSSNIPLDRKHDFGYHELITVDWPAVIRLASQRYPNSKRILMGHSMGGEISSLFVSANPEAVDGLILVASGTSHFSGWPFPGKVLIPILSIVMWWIGWMVGYYPGSKLKLMGDDAITIMRDSARNSIFGDYVVAGSGVRYDPMMANMALPLLAVSFSDDIYNTPGSTDNLCAKMPNAKLRRIRLSPSDLGLEKAGHFQWVRKGEPVADLISKWIGEVLSQPSVRIGVNDASTSSIDHGH